MALKDDRGFWISPQGKIYDPKTLRPVEVKRDKMVEEIITHAKSLQSKMQQAKASYREAIEKYMLWLQKHHKADAQDSKGNLTLTGFSGDQQIVIKVNDIHQFDEQLKVAMQIIVKCAEKWKKGACRNMRIIANEIFKSTKTGDINKSKILEWRRWNIRDRQWQKAMDIIAKSEHMTGTKSYMQIRVRSGAEGKWENINLNFSTLDTE